MKPIRILWICSHRTHRYEELSLLLRAGAEVVPIAIDNPDFPNALDDEENADPLYPDWRKSLMMPEDIAMRLRAIDYYNQNRFLSVEEKQLINKWFDVVLVASFTEIAESFLNWFSGYVILRAFGGYPYSGILKPLTYRGHRRLNKIAHSAKFIWCPIIPYLTAVEDARVTRSEVLIPPCVSRDRYPCEWLGTQSQPYICEVISLIERYRSAVYRDYCDSFGELPLKIFGQNEKTRILENDSNVVGTLPDSEYYSQLATCRAMLYLGLDNKYHLHYHVLEAVMMKVPIIFFSNGSIAHIARYYGLSDEQLARMGMCQSRSQAVDLAKKCLFELEFALQLSQNQEKLRELFSSERVFHAVEDFVNHLTRNINYEKRFPAESLSVTTRKLHKIFQKLTG